MLKKFVNLKNLKKIKCYKWDSKIKKKNYIKKKQQFFEKYFKENIDQNDLDYSTNTIIVPTGKYQITSDLVFPKDHILTINPGVELDLLNSGKIISYSPIHFLGDRR
mgnify:CR=1 FL=1